MKKPAPLPSLAIPLTEEILALIAQKNPTGVGEHPIIQQLLAQRKGQN